MQWSLLPSKHAEVVAACYALATFSCRMRGAVVGMLMFRLGWVEWCGREIERERESYSIFIAYSDPLPQRMGLVERGDINKLLVGETGSNCH